MHPVVAGVAIIAVLAPAGAARGDGVWECDAKENPLTMDLDARLPLGVVGGGTSRDGLSFLAAAGYGWGRRFICGGYAIRRVLAGVRVSENATALSLTYGWYGAGPISGGFDIGVEGDRRGAGPLARLTAGSHGIAVRFGGGYHFGDPQRWVGEIALVVEVTEIIDANR